MADKLTQQITDALTRSAAEPSGLPLYAGKSEPGLFSSTTSARLAAQKCLADGLVRVVGPDPKGKSPRELYGLTEKGWEFLLAQVNPRQVLEDFVRVLEARRGEVGELLDVARRMADSLQGLKDAVTRILPSIIMERIPLIRPHSSTTSEGRTNAPAPSPEKRPHPPTPSSWGRGGVNQSPRSQAGTAQCAGRLREAGQERGLESEGVPGLGDYVHTETDFHPDVGSPVAVLELPPVALATDLAGMILTRLADWSGIASEDCPLPELFRSLSISSLPPTIGEFHDCLRRLDADGAIYLHPWTAPLYALPEPAYALLAGHTVAYYASLKKG